MPQRRSSIRNSSDQRNLKTLHCVTQLSLTLKGYVHITKERRGQEGARSKECRECANQKRYMSFNHSIDLQSGQTSDDILYAILSKGCSRRMEDGARLSINFLDRSRHPYPVKMILSLIVKTKIGKTLDHLKDH